MGSIPELVKLGTWLWVNGSPPLRRFLVCYAAEIGSAICFEEFHFKISHYRKLGAIFLAVLRANESVSSVLHIYIGKVLGFTNNCKRFIRCMILFSKFVKIRDEIMIIIFV